MSKKNKVPTRMLCWSMGCALCHTLNPALPPSDRRFLDLPQNSQFRRDSAANSLTKTSAADCGEHRQAAGAFAEAVIGSAMSALPRKADIERVGMSALCQKQTVLRAMICVDGSALSRFYNKQLIRRRFAAPLLYRRIEGEISHSNFLLKCNTALVVRNFTLPGTPVIRPGKFGTLP
jgi:hypothetical protein